MSVRRFDWVRRPAFGVKRLVAAIVMAGGVLAGLALAYQKPTTSRLEIGAIDVRATPIAAFDRAQSSKRTFGKLEWRGGLVLTSSAREFGGWSGLTVDSEGKSFVAVSDAGTWMTGEITYDGTAPAGLKDTVIGPLQSRDGQDADARAGPGLRGRHAGER